jgi:spermidine synthase
LLEALQREGAVLAGRGRFPGIFVLQANRLLRGGKQETFDIVKRNIGQVFADAARATAPMTTAPTPLDSRTPATSSAARMTVNAGRKVQRAAG